MIGQKKADEDGWMLLWTAHQGLLTCSSATSGWCSHHCGRPVRTNWCSGDRQLNRLDEQNRKHTLTLNMFPKPASWWCFTDRNNHQHQTSMWCVSLKTPKIGAITMKKSVCTENIVISRFICSERINHNVL